MTQKTGKLTSESVDRLVHLGGTGPFDSGRMTLNYLNPSTDNPVAGHGTQYSVTMDGPELVEFTMRRPTESSPRLTRRLVRDAPVDAIAELARSEMRSDRQSAMNEYMLEHLEGIPLTLQDGSVVPFRMAGIRKFASTVWSDFKRPGRAGRPDVEYAALAAEYVQECRGRGGRGAAVSIANRHGLSPATVRNLLYEATRRGLKTKADPGMAGGELTQKAIDLLSEGAA